MLNYVTIRKYKHTKHLNRLWNSEFRTSYPLKKDFFKTVIVENVNLNYDASFVALYDNEPVGFIFIKTWFNESGLVSENDAAHISLIFVKKEMRNMGIGSDMLQLAITELKKYHNIKKIVVGNDIHRIFSGVPSEMNSAAIFFVNKGFIQQEANVDMIRVVRNDKIEEFEKTDLKTTIATEEEKDEILKLCVKNGWKREAYLVNQYYENGGSGRRIAIGLKDDRIVAFVRFNDENKTSIKIGSLENDKKLGCIYFARVDEDYQNTDYEMIMNKVAKNYMIKRGCKKIIILSTKKIKFYKELGFSAYKYYLQFELPL